VAREIAYPESAVARELRLRWLTQEVVSIALDDRCFVPRVKGRVRRVSPTAATATIEDAYGEILVPLDAVLSVRLPHFSEPLDSATPSPPETDRDRELPGQLSFEGL
jgi:hypothetical protein